MVAFTSLIGAAAIYAGVASASPMMDYSPMMGSSSSSADKSAYTPPPGMYGSGYGSGNSDNKPAKKMTDSSSSSWSMATSTSAAYAANTTPAGSYGSGSSNWNNNGGYDSCVQQCVAQFGSPSSMSMPPSSTPAGSSLGNGAAPPPGNGATHTVIVAPTQGVLRYVPFAVNASVGDTVLFMWGAKNHTVTKSSQLEICNKTSDNPFTTGQQSAPFTFTQVVNSTDPVFYYCGTPTHCEKGMFGIINPPNANQQPESASNMMPSLASQNPSTQAAWSYTSNVTANNSLASNWGTNLNMSALPVWAQSYAAENMMYTQAFIAMNADTVTPEGNIDLSALKNNAIMLPTDVAAAARQNNAQASTPSSSTTSSTASPTPSSGAASGGLKSGASALASPRVAVALVAVAAGFFAF